MAGHPDWWSSHLQQHSQLWADDHLCQYPSQSGKHHPYHAPHVPGRQTCLARVSQQVVLSKCCCNDWYIVHIVGCSIAAVPWSRQCGITLLMYKQWWNTHVTVNAHTHALKTIFCWSDQCRVWSCVARSLSQCDMTVLSAWSSWCFAVVITFIPTSVRTCCEHCLLHGAIPQWIVGCCS